MGACDFCGKELPDGKRFCNNICSLSWGRAERHRKAREEWEKIAPLCECGCGRKLNRDQQHYATRECQARAAAQKAAARRGNRLDTETRLCVTCEKEKPLREFFGPNRRGTKLDQPNTRCNACIAAGRKRTQEDERWKVRAVPEQDLMECWGGMMRSANYRPVL